MTAPDLTLRAPPSKSHTQRLLVLGALAGGKSRLRGPLDCEDTRRTRSALESLGCRFQETSSAPECSTNGAVAEDWLISGSIRQAPRTPIDCGGAGTTLRFCAALALIIDGTLLLDGDESLRRRPIDDLAATLERLGISVRFRAATGFAPIELHRRSAPPARAQVEVYRSSQSLSGLLLVAPTLAAPLTLQMLEPPVSQPYVDMTLAAMRDCGVVVESTPEGYRTKPSRYAPFDLVIAADWSSAAFLLAGAYITDVSIRIPNLDAVAAEQGDRKIAGMLPRLRQPVAVELDLRDTPDLLPPLAAAAVFATAPVTLAGVAHARAKESDRVGVLCEGLRATGVAVEEREDALRVTPIAGALRPTTLDPQGDHRMAMAFGLLSLRQPGIHVRTPGCVAKSYPGFWQDLECLRRARRT